jgi:MFS family permease
MLLTTRFIHGLFGAAMGVVSQAIIRDRTSGDAMAKLMSMIFLIFMIVPIIAPTIGQGVLLVADWRWIFLMLAGGGIAMAVWVGLRLAETLNPADVAPIAPASLARTWRSVATHRSAMAYMLGSSIAAGANSDFSTAVSKSLARPLAEPIYSRSPLPAWLAPWHWPISPTAGSCSNSEHEGSLRPH